MILPYLEYKELGFVDRFIVKIVFHKWEAGKEMLDVVVEVWYLITKHVVCLFLSPLTKFSDGYSYR